MTPTATRSATPCSWRSLPRSPRTAPWWDATAGVSLRGSCRPPIPRRPGAPAGGLRSALVAPMLWRDELIGSLGVASKQGSAFGPRDAQFLMAVATEVTALVRMAPLVEELQSTSGHLARARAEAVSMLAAAPEFHDLTTGLHLQNVR